MRDVAGGIRPGKNSKIFLISGNRPLGGNFPVTGNSPGNRKHLIDRPEIVALFPVVQITGNRRFSTPGWYV